MTGTFINGEVFDASDVVFAVKVLAYEETRFDFGLERWRPVTRASSAAISSPRTWRSTRRRRARSRAALGLAHPLNRST